MDWWEVMSGRGGVCSSGGGDGDGWFLLLLG